MRELTPEEKAKLDRLERDFFDSIAAVTWDREIPLTKRVYMIMDMQAEICLDLFRKAASGGVSKFQIDRVERMMVKLDEADEVLDDEARRAGLL